MIERHGRRWVPGGDVVGGRCGRRGWMHALKHNRYRCVGATRARGVAEGNPGGYLWGRTMPVVTMLMGAVCLAAAFMFARGAILGAQLQGPPVGTTGREVSTTTVVVQPGDRLWTIARRLYGDQVDTRWAVEAIRELNGPDCVRLRPATTLTVPTPEVILGARPASLRQGRLPLGRRRSR